jgi:hypothetical protein
MMEQVNIREVIIFNLPELSACVGVLGMCVLVFGGGGCFGNMCTCIYCALYCLYCVFLCCFVYDRVEACICANGAYF